MQRNTLYIPSGSDIVFSGPCWFGSYKETAGFTPSAIAAILSQSERTSFRRGLAGGVITLVNDLSSIITTNDACDILIDIGCGSDELLWGKFVWTPHSLKNTVYSNWRASSISGITFWGGPPTRWGPHSGKFLEMLADRLAVTCLLEGLHRLDTLYRKYNLLEKARQTL